MDKKLISKKYISSFRIISQLAYLCLFISAVVSRNIIFTFALICAGLLGPIFCGWLCFFGFYQDVLRYVGKLIKKDPIEIDEKIDKYLKFSRYLVLVGIVSFGSFFAFPDEMKHSLAATVKGHVHLNIAFYAVFILGVFSLFTKRFYCRYLCTFGAKQGLLSLIRPLTIKRNAKNCINCKICSSECSMHITVHSSNNLANPNCINCFKCIEKCPRNSLRIGLRNYLKP